MTRLLERLRGAGPGAAFTRGALSAFTTDAAGTLTAFGVQILLARLLGVHSYGIYAYALSWMTALLLFVKFGFDAAALRFVPEYSGRQDWASLRGFLRASHRIVLALSLAGTAIAAALVWLLRQRLAPELAATLRLAFLLLPLNALLQVSGTALQGLRRILQTQSLQNLLRPLLLAAGVCLAALARPGGADAPAAMLANLAAAALTLALTWRLLRRSLPPSVAGAPPAYRHGEWIQVAVSMFLISGFHLILAQTDILMIGTLLSTTASGIYAVASRLTTAITFGFTAVNVILAPMISELYAQNRRRDLHRVLRLASWGTVAYSLPAALVLALGGRWFLGLFGEAFTEGYAVLLVLSLGQLIVSLTGSVAFLMTMTGHHREATSVIGASALLNLVLNSALIPLLGSLGAAIATMVATVVRAVWLSLGIRKHLQMPGTALGYLELRQGLPWISRPTADGAGAPAGDRR